MYATITERRKKMKEILMFYRDDCGYCDMAFRVLEELKSVHPEYGKIPFRKVEETQDPV